MAERPIFLPETNDSNYVKEAIVSFDWFPGFSVQQKQRSIASLHENACKTNSCKSPLEVSSKSDLSLGVELSAFNLMLATKDYPSAPVEVFFQGSKKFTNGGPYNDLFDQSPRDAKRDKRLTSSGSLQCFMFAGYKWGLETKTAFYDWLYISALTSNPELARNVANYDGFTDIEFNPKKSLNCQARALALYVAIQTKVNVVELIKDPESFIDFCYSKSTPHALQTSMFEQ